MSRRTSPFLPPLFTRARAAAAVAACAASLLFMPVGGRAENAPAAAKLPPEAMEPGVKVPFATPSPIDKFMALDQRLKGVKWGDAYHAVALDLGDAPIADKEVALPMALGARIADGVMVIMARDIEALNQCATDIERMAKRLGLVAADLEKAKQVRAAANRGKWLDVFLELGCLQQQIMGKIDAPENKINGTLMMVSGWLQGARYATWVIEGNYSADAAGVLREPWLVRQLLEKMEALPEPVKAKAPAAKAIAALRAIVPLVDVPRDGSRPIPVESVREIQSLSGDVVRALAPAP